MKTLSLFAGLALALTIGSAQAQTRKLTTLFASNNGGAAGGAVYFDIDVINAIRITAFETNYIGTAAVQFKVYTTPTTSVGKETTKSAWTLRGQDNGKAVSAGLNNRTMITLAAPFILTPGKYGIAIESGGSGHRYTNGNGTNQNYANADLKLNLGKASNVAFSGGLFSPRVWNGSFIYTLGKGLFSSFSATPTKGKSPLAVQFKDTTFTSNPPVKTWAWDFNGDNVIDSRLQNPKFTFTATGFDKTFDVTLTTTDGTNPASKVTKKAFIRVNPSDATAIDYGKGTTNKPAPTPIDLPPNTAHFSSARAVRGFYFVAPTTFIIQGFQAANTFTPKQTDQTVTCYVLAAPPTGPYTVKAADVKFHGSGKANTILRPSSLILVKKGQWVGVLGAGHGAAAGSPFRNSYGPGAFKSTVRGQAITLNRLWMNSDSRINKGLGVINQSTGVMGRVFIHVAGNTAVPILTTIGLPKLGATAKLDFDSKFNGAVAGLLLLGQGRLPPLTTPFGDLLVRPPFLQVFFIPGGKGQFSVPIPANPAFTGTILDWQGVGFNVSAGINGMSNGTEWFIGR